MKRLIILFGTFGFALQARAVCPVCTIAVAGGVGLAREFGLDDALVGVWIGGFTMSLSLWFYDWLLKKGKKFWGMKAVSIVAMYAMAILPLFFMKDVWHPLNTLWGINKLLLGTVIGSVFFYLSPWLNQKIKDTNGGKQYFPFQKVVVPVCVLLILTAVFYFITK